MSDQSGSARQPRRSGRSGTPVRRASGGRETARRTPLTVERIVASALAIIDVEGTHAVTMRRVAGDLGVSASSLYEHVSNREELLDLAADAVSREIGDPVMSGDWRADLRSWFVRAHEVYTAHGDIAFLHFGSVPARPQQIRAMEQMLTTLIDGGVPATTASYGIERLSIYTIADAYEGWEFRRRTRGVPSEQIASDIRAAFDDLPEDEFPTTRRHAGILMAAGGDQLFEVGLDLIIAGMAAMASGSTDQEHPRVEMRATLHAAPRESSSPGFQEFPR